MRDQEGQRGNQDRERVCLREEGREKVEKVNDRVREKESV